MKARFIELDSIQQLDELFIESLLKPVVLFKHSNSCGISTGVWHSFYLTSPFDEDWFQFYVSTATGPRWIEVWLQSIPPGIDYDLALYSPTNTFLDVSNAYGNTDEYIKFWVDQSGDYRVRVYPYTGYNQSDSYQLKVAVSAAPSVPEPATLMPLSPPKDVSPTPPA